MQKIIDSLGGRKFIFAEVLVVLLAVMIMTKVDMESIKTFFTYATTIFGLYVAGNVGSKAVTKPESEPENKQ